MKLLEKTLSKCVSLYVYHASLYTVIFIGLSFFFLFVKNGSGIDFSGYMCGLQRRTAGL